MPDELNVARVEEIVSRMRKLDESAFADFADIFGPILLRLFRSKGLPEVDAEDLAISCISDLALSIDRYETRPNGSFAAWVHRFATNRAMDWHRRAKRSREAQEEAIRTAVATDDFDEVDLEVQLAVQTALSQLDNADRQIVMQRIAIPPVPYGDIASDLNLSEQNARVRFHRARKTLERLLRGSPTLATRLAKTQ